VKYGRMESLRQHYPVALMSRVFEVSESGYYAWRDRPLSARTQENARLEIEIRAAHQRTRETFGPERNFTATAPNRVWVSDITYIMMWSNRPGHSS